jgi:hypothetical protein
MRQGIWRSAPALAISAIALFVALGGTVYAAKKAKIDGKAIRAKSIPGNRLKPRSIAANRLKPGVLKEAYGLSGQLTGAEINELTLGQVPSAAHADTADTAQSAVDAQTALNAVNAIDAKTINGYGAGCEAGATDFAGACWESSGSIPVSAPVAAAKCAARGGSLPEALQLAAFAGQPGVSLHGSGEWTSDLSNVSGPNAYGVMTVLPNSTINLVVSSDTRAYRCVIPLLS